MRACGECIIGSSAQVGLRHSFLMSAPFAPAWGARTYIMGILNATPDSFSGDGLGLDLEAILRRAESFVRDGADLLDVGGESSRPGAEPIPLAEELRRVVPAVEALYRTQISLAQPLGRLRTADAADDLSLGWGQPPFDVPDQLELLRTPQVVGGRR